MTTAILVLVLVGLAVWLSASRAALSPQSPADRDGERQLGELRALTGSRADVHL